MFPSRNFLILLLMVEASVNLAAEQPSDYLPSSSVRLLQTNLTNLTNTSSAPSAILLISESPSSSPITKEQTCENTPGWLFGSSVLYECDDDFVWCSDEGASENCCKCKEACCGLCDSRNHPYDIIQPCHYGPTRRPTGRPTYAAIDPLPMRQKEEKGLSVGTIIGIGTFALFLFVVILVLHFNHRQQNGVNDINTIRRTMAERRRFGSNEHSLQFSARLEQIRSSFFFETVLPDKSNANARSIRSLHDGVVSEEGEDDNSTVNEQECEEECEKEEQRIVAPKKRDSRTVKKDSQAKRENQLKRDSRAKRDSHRNSHTSPRSLRDVFASWTKPSPKDECCICLDGYTPGDTICLARTDECEHVFHRDCLLEWIKDHDCCPLCRAELVKS